MADIKHQEEKIEGLKLANEVASEEVSLAQKKQAIREAKRKYGPDWKQVLGIVRSIKVNQETMQDLHSMGMGGSEMRDLSRPPGVRQL